MKKIGLAGILAFFLVSVASAQTLRIATYNMRYDNPGDSLDRWQQRLPIIASLVRFYDFDVMGGQELLNNQVIDLTQQLPEYDHVGVGRDDGKEKGEFSAVFFKKDKFRLLKSGTFWLSETSDEPSKGWDAALPRICSWACLEDKITGFKFYAFNTHFDHRGVVARKESGRLLAEQIQRIAGDTPAVLTGDFNFDEHHEGYASIIASGKLKNTYDLAPVKMANGGTFNSFNVNSKAEQRIDHIFVTSAFDVKRYGILTNSYRGRFPSDHFPVMVELSAGKTTKKK